MEKQTWSANRCIVCARSIRQKHLKNEFSINNPICGKCVVKLLDVMDKECPISSSMFALLCLKAEAAEIHSLKTKEGIEKARSLGVKIGRECKHLHKTEEIVRLLEDGLTNQAIADILRIGKGTVWRLSKKYKEGKKQNEQIRTN